MILKTDSGSTPSPGSFRAGSALWLGAALSSQNCILAIGPDFLAESSSQFSALDIKLKFKIKIIKF